uniref:PNPLA domain-containing protein n=1 Tax=viral metagenome TaxID=1070528 RepID=A0A6C0JRY0_9ZZZZ
MFKTIVLSAGAEKGVGMLGILHRLIVNKKISLTQIDNFVGSSVGAVICALLTINKTPIDILFDIVKLLPMSCSKEKNKIYSLLENHFKNLTFLDLFNSTKKNLVITSFNILERKSEFYSYKVSPNKNVFEALKETISIPFCMEESFNQSSLDGSLCTPFPIKHCKNENYGKIFGIYTYPAYDNIFQIRNVYDDINVMFLSLFNLILSYEIAFSDKEDYLIELKYEAKYERYFLDFETAFNLFFLDTTQI